MTPLAAISAGLAAAALSLGFGEPTSPSPVAADPLARAAALSPGELAGERLIAGWDGDEPPGGLRRLVRSGGIAGVILFDDNVGSRSATRRRLRALQRLAPKGQGPLLVTVDQEGGLVKRIPGPPGASAARMGARGTSYARRQGRRTARTLRAYGVNVDLAPVLDVARPGGAMANEGRAFGGSPGRVIRTGVRGFAGGLRAGGVATTAKHFPGIGMIATNTDFAGQKVRTSKRLLRRRDERPFAAFSKAGGELVMLSLATYTAFSDRPAAMSRKLATGELRRRVGFEGVSISDALDATAATQVGGTKEVALATAGAGTDLLLYPDWREARRVRDLLRDGLRRGRLDRREFEASAARVLALRDSLR